MSSTEEEAFELSITTEESDDRVRVIGIENLITKVIEFIDEKEKDTIIIKKAPKEGKE